MINKLRQLSAKLQESLGPRQFIIVAGIVAGLYMGLVAVLLKTLVHTIRHLLMSQTLLTGRIALCLFPIAGIWLTIRFTKRFLNGNLNKGVADVLQEIAQKASRVKRHKLYSQVVSSALTVGFGGSSGLEAPIAVTGSATGSNLAQFFRLNYRDRTTLLGCGAAAGIAGAFNAPIAGVMFVIEVLLAEVTTATFIPLVIAAACGALCSKIILNQGILFNFSLQEPFNYQNLPFYIGLAMFTAGVSVYYSKATHFVEGAFARLGDKIYWKLAIGGLLLAALISVFPSLFGEGTESIVLLSEDKTQPLLKYSVLADYFNTDFMLVVFVGATIFLKVIATSTTLSIGGNGGNFAPSLFVGANAGFFYAKVVNWLNIAPPVPVSNFTIVAMAGVLSGVMYAPLTGIFLIAEITGGYELMIPLMIVSTISYALVKRVNPYSMDTAKFAAQGRIFTHDKDKNILLLLRTSKLIELEFKTILPHETLGALVNLIASSNRNIFIITDDDYKLLGVLTLDDVREIMFKKELYNTVLIKDIMKAPPAIIQESENMTAIMEKFDQSGAWSLPVVEPDGTYIGMVSKSSILANYRHQLIKLSSEA